MLFGTFIIAAIIYGVHCLVRDHNEWVAEMREIQEQIKRLEK